MVYGVIHRELLEEDFSEPENPVIINSPYMPAEGESVAVIDDNTFIFTYYVSAALPGQYVIEPAYITPYRMELPPRVKAAGSRSGKLPKQKILLPHHQNNAKIPPRYAVVWPCAGAGFSIQSFILD